MGGNPVSYLLPKMSFLNLPHAMGLGALPMQAPELFTLGPLKVTNSALYSWIVVLLIIAVVQIAVRRPKLVPHGLQNVCEWVVESLQNMLVGIVGHHMIKKTFPLLCTFFIFIFTANITGLLPGVGTVGWGSGEGFFGVHVHDPLLRPANADINMTLALTAIFFVFWFYWTFSEVGVGGFVKHLFAPKGTMTLKGRPWWLLILILGLNILLITVFLMVGLIEIVSIASRGISLPIRLFGNIFAGENLLHAMTSMGGPWAGILVGLPFYILEILVSLLQALVFTLLCAVYVQLSTAHEEGEHH
jgi:F-type H+-transporting ATPase subunit a